MAASRMRLDTEDAIAKVVGASCHQISGVSGVARLCYHLVLLNFEI